MEKNIDNDFEEFYNNLNQTEFQDLWKSVRKSRNISLGIGLTLCLIVNIFLAIGIVKIIPEKFIEESTAVFILLLVFFILIMDFFVLVFANIFRARKKDVNYSELYKDRVIKKALNNFFSDVDYKPYYGIDKELYDQGKYDEKCDFYDSEDYTEMKLNNKNNVIIGEVITKYTVNKTDRTSYAITEFAGLFSQILLNRNTGLKIRIRTEKIPKYNKDNELNFEEFLRLFALDTNDLTKTKHILTYDVMKELIDVREELKHGYDLFIDEDRLFIRIRTGDLFESIVNNKEIISKKRIGKDFNIIKCLYRISNKIVNIIDENRF